MDIQTTRHHPGTAVKTLDNGRVGGYLVVWGDSTTKDLQGEYFTSKTDFALDWFERRPMLYHHGLDGNMKTASVGTIDHLKVDDIGIWAEAQLDMHKRYVDAVHKLVKQGALNWSSGSLAHLVEVDEDGQIKRWPLIEGSLTPTPAEPRNTDVKAIKSAYQELGLDISKLSLSTANGTQKPKEVTTPKEASSGLKADDFNIENNLITHEGVKMTNEEFKQLVSDEVKSAIAKMTSGDAPLPEEEEAAVAADLTDEVVSKMDEEYKMDDPESAKSVTVVDIRNAARKAIVEVLPTVLDNALTARAKYERELESIAAKAATAKARQEAPVKSNAGFGNSNPAQKQDIQIRTKFERAGWTAEDYSFAVMLAGNNPTNTSVKGVNGIVDEQFAKAFADTAIKAYNAGKIVLSDGALKSVMAIKDDEVMYSTLSSYGDEHVPTVWADNIWDKPRIDVVIPNLLETVEMPSNPYEYPIEGADPTIYFVPETADSASLSLDATSPAIPSTRVGSGKITFSAKKLGMNIFISAELEEDGLTRLIPKYRAQAEKAFLEAQDSVAFNGDVSTTGNINADGESITATTRNYQAYDGLIHQALVTTTAGKVDAQGAAPTLSHLRQTRAKLGSQVKGNPSNLAIICDPSTYLALLSIDAVLTVDKYGSEATVVRGELGRIDGIRVFQSDQIALADADGKVTQAGNTVNRGRLLMLHVPSWLLGYRRRIAQHLQFMPHYDTHVLSMTMRNHLVGQTYSGSAQAATDDRAAILYNIGV